MTLRARRLLTAFLASAALAVGTTAPTLSAAQVYASPTHAKYAAVVVDAASGEVLYARRADSPRYPASITKVMTLYLAFEALASGKLKADDTIVISPRAAAQPPSKLGLRAGETIRVDDAISALAVKSANDISVALAERIGGTEQRFTAMMTLRAQELGMRETRFVNANGLPDSRQLSSARDIATLSRAVMRDYPQYYGRFSQRQFTFRGHTMNNHNRLLHRMPGVDGIKTGFTNASGYNLAASAVRDGRRLIAVVLGGTSGASRDAHTADLLNAGFNVLARRSRGETISLAAMFPEQASPVQLASVRGSVEQGDSEPVKPTRSEAKVLAAAVETKAVNKKLRGIQALEEASEGKTKADLKKIKGEPEAKKDAKKKGETEKAEKADSPKSGGWYVQVGAFPEESDAEDRLKQVLKKYGKQFKGADGRVQKAASGGHWRARFHGLDAEEAKAACKALDAKKEPCLAVKS
jgi:D-alanyl-D-alanine carboxypeptidase (penicillin-binding protein 5/6)